MITLCPTCPMVLAMCKAEKEKKNYFFLFFFHSLIEISQKSMNESPDVKVKLLRNTFEEGKMKMNILREINIGKSRVKSCHFDRIIDCNY